MRTKGETFVSAITYILKGIWKLLMLCIYAIAKITEVVAGFIAKITNKFLN